MTDSPWLTRSQVAERLHCHVNHVDTLMAMLDASGGDVVAVSKALGHGSIAITVDTYSKEADNARRRAAEAMDRAMDGTG